MKPVSTSLAFAALAVLAGCVGVETQPTAENRQAIAPHGKLRAGMLMVANHATKDPATGELKGIAVDLGREAARRLGVSYEPVGFTSFGALWTSLKAGELNMATAAITPERAKEVDFTKPYMIVEFTFLVPGDSPMRTPADVDKAGIGVAVLKQASPHAHLSSNLRRATVMAFDTVPEMVGAMKTGKVQALFGTRAGMLNQVQNLPGSRVMDLSFGGEETAIAVPKGQAARAAYLDEFVRRAKSDGLIKAAIERAGVKGMSVAP